MVKEKRQLTIDTGQAVPIKQSAQKISFVAHREIAQQIKSVQDSGVIQLSSSLWASPVVLVQKS